tara:strand:+ start:786 stop:1100 length:315 start_codon:yes stop_codon:yes gene_type:complete
MKKLKINADTTLKYFQVFNGILELTYRELQVLAKLVDMGETIDLCSATNKKIVAKDMGIKDYNTLNNYVKRLKDKKAIKKTKDGYELNPLLVQQGKVVIEIHTP